MKGTTKTAGLFQYTVSTTDGAETVGNPTSFPTLDETLEAIAKREDEEPASQAPPLARGDWDRLPVARLAVSAATKTAPRVLSTSGHKATAATA